MSLTFNAVCSVGAYAGVKPWGASSYLVKYCDGSNGHGEQKKCEICLN